MKVEVYVKSDYGIRTLLKNFLKLYLSYGLVAEEELEFEILVLLNTDPHDLIYGELKAVLKSNFLESPKFRASLHH